MRPQTTEQFELTVRNVPNNAACWTAYMNHVLSAGSPQAISTARTVAERGLRQIVNAVGMDPAEHMLQQARLLSFYLVMEAKELDRCTQRLAQYEANVSGVDPVSEKNEQAARLSHVLTRLVQLDQPQFTRKAIETLAGIGQFDVSV